MAKGISIILTLVLLVAAITIIAQYSTASMSSTATGVNLTSAPQEIRNAYNASTNTTIITIGLSRQMVLFIGIFAVVLILVVLVAMTKANKKH